MATRARNKITAMAASLLAVSLLASPGPGVAGEAAPRAFVDGDTVVIKGSSAGMVPLTIAEAVTFDLSRVNGQHTGFEASESDSVAGVFLTERQQRASGSIGYAVFKLPMSYQSSTEIALAKTEAGSLCEICPLPAGEYNLHLLTNEPVEITLTFSGLESDREEVIGKETGSVLADGVPSITGGPNGTARQWTAIANGELSKSGARLLLLYFEGPATPVANVVAFGTCTYGSGGPPAVGVTAGCAGGSHALGGVLNHIQSKYGVTRLEMGIPAAQGASSMGAYADLIGEAGTHGLAGVWVEL